MSAGQFPILAINNGSSSLKFSVLDPKAEVVLSAGIAERIGTEQGLLKLTDLEEGKEYQLKELVAVLCVRRVAGIYRKSIC